MTELVRLVEGIDEARLAEYVTGPEIVGTLWNVAPSYGHFTYTLWDIGSLLGVGGIWLYFFIGQLKGQTIIPIHETWVEEAIREGAIKVNA